MTCNLAAADPLRTETIEIIDSALPTPFADRAKEWPSIRAPQTQFNPNAQTVSEQLNSVPGIHAREAGSPTVSIRGSAQADRVLKLFDGIPLNMADGLGASDLFLPSEILGDTRIIKGPASVFYGSSAMAGAIDHTPRFYDRKGLRLSAADDGGLFGTRSAFAVVPLRSEDGQSKVQLSAFREHAPGRFPYQSVSGYGSGRREHNSTDLTRFTVLGEWRTGGFLIRPRALFANASGETPNSLATPLPMTFDKQGSLFAIDAEKPFGDSSLFGARIFESRLKTSYTAFGSTDTSNSSRTSASFDLDSKLASVVRVRNFVDLNRGEFDATYFVGQRFIETRFEAGQIYDLELLPQNALMLQPSFRYNSETGDFIKAIALISSSESVRSWLTYSEGLRIASLSDRFANTSFFVGNPGLRPERSQSVEFGGRLGADERQDGFSLELSIYEIRSSDFVDTTSVSPGVLSKINSGSSRATGGEVSTGFASGKQAFTLSYGYLDARNTDTGETLRLSPRHQVGAAIAQRFGLVIMELKDTFWSEFYDRDPSNNALRALPSWNTLDLNVRTEGLKDWELRGGVLNIFNQPRELTLGFPEPQRRVHLSALRYF